jgi:uncharacterized membrane protein HdeD (DUF308 family)
MKAIKNYGWSLKIVAAAILLALAVYLIFNLETGEIIISVFMGAIIIIYSAIRLVPFIKTQGSELVKTVNIIEITVSVLVGLILIIIPTATEIDINVIFSYLIGGYLMVRGTVHFFSVSLHKEKSDAPLFIFHILALTVGSYIFTTWGNFDLAIILWIILIFSVGTSGYLSYDGYKGYRTYRFQKTLSMPDHVSDGVSDTVDAEVILPIVDEEREQDHIVS